MEITKNQVTEDLAVQRPELLPTMSLRSMVQFDQVRAGSSKAQRILDLDSEENHELPSPEVLSSTSVSGPQARDTVMSGALQLAAAEEEGVWRERERRISGPAYELPRQ
ncbi:hypothetical protein N7452_011078 [Penicillium brevicompactum]|uniref:Uncharacterized protein n=1 Tax=Penicillium brevicompactum TaxID=5074 RepID=A0A9W9U8R5_PENBR|nr:hypothetical protein N7452_011078 [Penicillium brevicompactum]